MSMYVGVDGCPAGWAAFHIWDGGIEFAVYGSASELWRLCDDAEAIYIDIPIGLPSATLPTRACDAEARKKLGSPRSSSVFPPPCRAALYGEDYEVGSAINFQVLGRKLPRQSWGIAAKMREVDELMRRDPKARRRIRELHPEVSFWALAGGRAMLNNKKSADGFEERMVVLEDAYPGSREIVDRALGQSLPKGTARDDIVDALVAAVTAELSKSSPARLPSSGPEFDTEGLTMEMVYWPRQQD